MSICTELTSPSQEGECPGASRNLAPGAPALVEEESYDEKDRKSSEPLKPAKSPKGSKITMKSQIERKSEAKSPEPKKRRPREPEGS